MKSTSYGPKRILGQGKGRSSDGEVRQKWYRSARWHALKVKHLRAEPYCRTCLEEYGEWNRKNLIVDHILGHGDPGWITRFWDPSCLQTLCKRHHDRKTALETGAGKSRDRAVKRISASQRRAIQEKLRESS